MTTLLIAFFVIFSILIIASIIISFIALSNSNKTTQSSTSPIPSPPPLSPFSISGVTFRAYCIKDPPDEFIKIKNGGSLMNVFTDPSTNFENTIQTYGQHNIYNILTKTILKDGIYRLFLTLKGKDGIYDAGIKIIINNQKYTQDSEVPWIPTDGMIDINRRSVSYIYTLKLNKDDKLDIIVYSGAESEIYFKAVEMSIEMIAPPNPSPPPISPPSPPPSSKN